jgi:excisionase family DNA binding protein
MPRKKSVPPVVESPAPTTAFTPRGLRVEQAAEYCGITVSLLRTLIGTGKITALKLGKRHVILKDDLDAFLDAQKRAA